jgi:hypothetical protein
MGSATLDAILAIATPYDDAFDREQLLCGTTIELIPLQGHGGTAITLQARRFGWCIQSLRQVIDDAQLTWCGHDDSAWEPDGHAC